MKLSSQEEYGLRCLLRVGRAAPGESLTIAELSRAEGISEPNVAKMMRVLRRGGFVNSTRGQAGATRFRGRPGTSSWARSSRHSAGASTSPPSARVIPESSSPART